jgi:hypothetical protein
MDRQKTESITLSQSKMVLGDILSAIAVAFLLPKITLVN